MLRQPNIDVMPGPCVICGCTLYPLSMGGPTICPKCDCGHFDSATVWQQAKVIEGLRAELEAARKSPDSDTARLLAALKECAAVIPDFGDSDEFARRVDIARAALKLSSGQHQTYNG